MMEGDVEAHREHDQQERSGQQERLEEALGRFDPAEVTQAVSAFARENPHVALAAAAGLGFLLGGGLSPKVLSTLGLIATRSYLKGTISQALQGMLSEQLQIQGQSGSA